MTDQAKGSRAVDDPRALQILSTEHWSLLSARALVYNESFARTGMLLTVLSASLVALALVAQAMGFGGAFLPFAAVVLGFDLFLALATLGRIGSTSTEDLRCIQGMNRIRHAYLEIAPGLADYFITSPYDDMPGILASYGEASEQHSGLATVVHALTTMDGMVGMIAAIVAGVFGGVIALVLGATVGVAALVGLAAGIGAFAALAALGARESNRFWAGLESRFPTPSPGSVPPGR